MPISNSSLTTLGGFAFSVDGNQLHSPATRKARALMSFLIMHRGTDTAREKLIDIFWPDADPDHARDSLNTALHSVRRCLKTAALEVDRFLVVTKAVIRWVAETIVDADEFARLATHKQAATDEEALRLYRGDFLEG